jgi:hypothetical protein
MPARTFVIGDVHGCVDELDRLLERLALEAGDAIVLVGDLVNKGPESLAVLKRCRTIGARAVMGNHDDLLLRCVASKKRGEDGDFPDAVKKLAKKIDDEDLAWLAALPLYLELREHRSIVVHAGLLAGVALARQDRAHLLTMRSIKSDGTPSKRIEEGLPWASLWTGPEHVLFGHDAVRGLQEWPFATGLDTACVYGGRLTAIELGARRLTSVQAKKVYAEPGKSVAALMDRKK